MSLVIAVKENGKVLMGADTQVSRGKEKRSVLVEDGGKIRKMSNGVIVGGSGAFDSLLALTMHDEWFDGMPEEGLTKQFLVERVVPALFDYLLKRDWLETGRDDLPRCRCTYLVAWRDRLFRIENDFSVWEVPAFDTVGCGDDAALAVFFDTRREGESAREKMLRALRLASRHDRMVSPPFVFIDTENDGYEIIGG